MFSKDSFTPLLNNIAALGFIGMDLINKVKNIPAKNEVIYSQGLQMIPGGKAANTAIGLSRLFNKVYF